MKKIEKFFFEPLLDDVVNKLKQEGAEVWPKTCSPGIPFIIFEGNMDNLAEDVPRHRIELTASNTYFVAEVIFDGLPSGENGLAVMKLLNSRTMISRKDMPNKLTYDDSFVEEIVAIITKVICIRRSVDKCANAIGA